MAALLEIPNAVLVEAVHADDVAVAMDVLSLYVNGSDNTRVSPPPDTGMVGISPCTSRCMGVLACTAAARYKAVPGRWPPRMRDSSASKGRTFKASVV